MLRLHCVTLIGVAGVDLPRFLFAADLCRQYCAFGDVKILTPFPCDEPGAVAIPPVTLDEYNQLIIKDLHQYVSTSHALIVQHDGFILNPDAWADEFLEYDYIGAPFWFKDEMNVGNGGFSLRSKRFLEATNKYVEGPPWTPEDLIVCRRYGRLLREKGMKFAPESVARRFSTDGNLPDDVVWNGQFGFHSFRSTSLAKWQPPASFHVDPWVILKRTWELEKTAADHVLRLRRDLRRLSREQARLRDELARLQRGEVSRPVLPQPTRSTERQNQDAFVGQSGSGPDDPRREGRT